MFYLSLHYAITKREEDRKKDDGIQFPINVELLFFVTYKDSGKSS